jgi:uncharacterized protein YjbI with pentapeptide repeats
MADPSDLMKAIRGDKNLSGANLSGADLSDAILSGADLSGANLEGTKMPEGWEFSVRDS